MKNSLENIWMKSGLREGIWSDEFNSLRFAIYRHSRFVIYRHSRNVSRRGEQADLRDYAILRDRAFSKISRLVKEGQDLLKLCQRMDSDFLEKWGQQMVQKEYELWKGEHKNEG